MSTKQPAEEPPVRRVDRVLTFMSLGIVVFSVVCFFVILIASAAGMQADDFGRGLWPIVAVVPMVGLPIGFVLMLTLIIMTMVRRGRAAKRPE